MKKLILGFLIIFPFILNAQIDVPNGGMETWTNVGASNEEPTEWNSLMTGNLCGLCGLGAQQCVFRESAPANIHSGTYSARIRTNVIFGNPANGVLTLGQVTAPSTSASDGYNVTLQANAAFNHGINSQPDSIVFWAKYVPQDATDSARVSVVVHDAYNLRDPQDAGSIPHVRSKAWRNFRTGGAWVRMSVPFNTINSGITPVYVLATFTSGKTPGAGTANTTLYIDDVSLVYNPTLTTGTINPLLYYVSASQGAPVSVPYTVTGTYGGGNIFTAQLSNSTGSFAAPVSLGTFASTSSGTVSGTIPAGTASGTQYRIRTIASSPTLTGSTNTSDIEIRLVSNSIAPSTTQTIATNTNGTAISVTESAGFLSREWKYSGTSGGPYTSFAPTESATSYTPNFSTTGTRYVVCETTYPNGIVVTSNEVQINVVGNSIAPSSPQSILVGVNGTTMTVSETPAGTVREWRWSTVSGGPYSSFAPVENGMAYTPNFAASGVYYVVCVSTISGVSCTSNEVMISVGSITLTTGTIVGSPFEFSPSAPNASVSVPYTVSGALNPGNVFTAQLSDGSGSFAAPVTIGSISTTTSGTISATILNSTLDGTGYRIRVISSTPAIFGSDNGSDLMVDQFDNAITPSGAQNILYNTNGTALTVNESQTSTRSWKYATVSGGPYSVFVPAENGASYTPNFALPGTYYVVAVSENTYNDTVVSNEVQINVQNGTTINTSALGTSVFYLSPNAIVTDNIAFTSDIIFNGGNVFTAEMSDGAGSFVSPTTIGTLTSSTVMPVPVTIPNGLASGSGYRIRITSSSPASIGSNNGSNLQVVQFESSIAPADTQYIAMSTNGNTLTASPNHPTGVTNEWKYKVGLVWTSFAPAETNTSYTPNFPVTGTYPITCFSTNMWNDTVQGGTVMIYVVPGSGIENSTAENITLIWNYDVLSINLQNSTMQNPQMEILNMEGKVVLNKMLSAGSMNMIQLNLASGLYICRISDQGQVFNQKFVKP
jgi:hypothetical protein